MNNRSLKKSQLFDLTNWLIRSALGTGTDFFDILPPKEQKEGSSFKFGALDQIKYPLARVFLKDGIAHVVYFPGVDTNDPNKNAISLAQKTDVPLRHIMLAVDSVLKSPAFQEKINAAEITKINKYITVGVRAKSLGREDHYVVLEEINNRHVVVNSKGWPLAEGSNPDTECLKGFIHKLDPAPIALGTQGALDTESCGYFTAAYLNHKAKRANQAAQANASDKGKERDLGDTDSDHQEKDNYQQEKVRIERELSQVEKISYDEYSLIKGDIKIVKSDKTINEPKLPDIEFNETDYETQQQELSNEKKKILYDANKKTYKPTAGIFKIVYNALSGAATWITIVGITELSVGTLTLPSFLGTVGSIVGTGATAMIAGASMLIAAPAITIGALFGIKAYRDNQLKNREGRRLANEYNQKLKALTKNLKPTEVDELVSQLKDVGESRFINALLYVKQLRKITNDDILGGKKKAEYDKHVDEYKKFVKAEIAKIKIFINDKKEFNNPNNPITDRNILDTSKKILTYYDNLSKLGIFDDRDLPEYKNILKDNHAAVHNLRLANPGKKQEYQEHEPFYTVDVDKSSFFSAINEERKNNGVWSSVKLFFSKLGNRSDSFMAGASIALGIGIMAIALTNPVGWTFIAATIAVGACALTVGALAVTVDHLVSKNQDKKIAGLEKDNALLDDTIKKGLRINKPLALDKPNKGNEQLTGIYATLYGEKKKTFVPASSLPKLFYRALSGAAASTTIFGIAELTASALSLPSVFGTVAGAFGVGVTAAISAALILVALPAFAIATFSAIKAYRDNQIKNREGEQLANEYNEKLEKMLRHSNVDEIKNIITTHIMTNINTLIYLAELSKITNNKIWEEEKLSVFIKTYKKAIESYKKTAEKEIDVFLNEYHSAIKNKDHKNIYRLSNEILSRYDNLLKLGVISPKDEDAAKNYQIILKNHHDAVHNLRNLHPDKKQKYQDHPSYQATGAWATVKSAANKVGSRLSSFMAGACVAIGIGLTIIALTNPVGWALVGAAIALVAATFIVGALAVAVDYGINKKQDSQIADLKKENAQLDRVITLRDSIKFESRKENEKNGQITYTHSFLGQELSRQSELSGQAKPEPSPAPVINAQPLEVPEQPADARVQVYQFFKGKVRIPLKKVTSDPVNAPKQPAIPGQQLESAAVIDPTLIISEKKITNGNT